MTSSSLIEAPQKCGFIALIGCPNAGKSTLMNALVGEKISIVSHKVQTTRRAIRGLLVWQKAQIIFVDTPGVFTPSRQRDQKLVSCAWEAAQDADRMALVVDAAHGLDAPLESLLQRLSSSQPAPFLILNKIDKMPRSQLLGLTTQLHAQCAFEKTFMISALKQEGLEKLKDAFAETVPAGPWLYPDDQLSEDSLRDWAAEITREKILKWAHEELPYETRVVTDSWKEHRNKTLRIEQTIFVARLSHKKMLIGEGGQKIKRISQSAREDISQALQQTVHLFVFVKVENRPAAPKAEKEKKRRAEKGQ